MVSAVIPTSSRSTQNWYFFTDKAAEDIGTTDGDIVMLLYNVKEQICGRVSNELIIGNTAFRWPLKMKRIYFQQVERSVMRGLR